MQSSNISTSVILPFVSRLEKELSRLKAVFGWERAVSRGMRQTKKQNLSPNDVLKALYASRYPASRRS